MGVRWQSVSNDTSLDIRRVPCPTTGLPRTSRSDRSDIRSNHPNDIPMIFQSLGWCFLLTGGSASPHHPTWQQLVAAGGSAKPPARQGPAGWPAPAGPEKCSPLLQTRVDRDRPQSLEPGGASEMSEIPSRRMVAQGFEAEFLMVFSGRFTSQVPSSS